MQHMGALDAMFLIQDSVTVPRQISSLAILEPGDNRLDHERLIRVIDDRIGLIPRYRQIALKVPASVGTPVWIDDEDFDIATHVRRAVLPEPGTTASLHDLVGRLIARRLDPDRPLWEVCLIEGLNEGRIALLFTSHQALVDGSETVDLAQVLLEETAHERDIPHEEWRPRPEPSGASLLLGSVNENLRHPIEGLGVARMNLGRITRRLPGLRRGSGGTSGPLSTVLSQYRRFASLETALDAYRLVREEHGGTVNDVILAAIAGGLRGWMLSRSESVTVKTSFRAMVPMSVVAEDGLPTSLGSKVRGHLLSLPVGEPNPVVRLHQVSYALKGHRETGSAVAANILAALPGFATSTFHAVGARVAETERGRGHQIVITNVPGPQEPVYMAGELVREVYPCIPLSDNHAVSIGVTSYNGKVFYGIVTDRQAVGDADVLAQCIDDALAELLATVGNRRERAPRGRAQTAQKPGEN